MKTSRFVKFHLENGSPYITQRSMRVLVEISRELQTFSRKSSNSRSSSSNLQFRIIRNFHGDVKKKCRFSVTHIFKSQRSLREALPKRCRIGKFPVKIFQCAFASFSHHSYIDRTNRHLIYFAHDEYVTRVYNKSVFKDPAVNRSRVLRRKTPSLLNRMHTSFMRYTNKLTKHVRIARYIAT